MLLAFFGFSTAAAKSRAFVDFGGKYIKICVSNRSGRVQCAHSDSDPFPAAVATTPDAPTTPKYLKSLFDGKDVVIGSRALRVLDGNQSAGTRFLGAVYGRSTAYLRANRELFCLDANATMSDVPPPWLLVRFFQKFESEYPGINKTVVLASPHTSLWVREQLTLAGTLGLLKTVRVYDQSLIYLRMAAASPKKNGMTVRMLFLDFGAFSAKAVMVAITNSKTGAVRWANVSGYAFSEDAGLEPLALRLSRRMKVDRHRLAGNLSEIENPDPLFEEEIDRIVRWSTGGLVVQEVQLVGGGANYSWVYNLVRRIIVNQSIPVKRRYNSLNALAYSGAKELRKVRLTKYEGGLWSIYFSQKSRQIELKTPMGSMVTHFAVANIRKAKFNLTTDSASIAASQSEVFGSYEIVNFTNTSLMLGQPIAASFNLKWSTPHVSECTLCGTNKCVTTKVTPLMSAEYEFVRALGPRFGESLIHALLEIVLSSSESKTSSGSSSARTNSSSTLDSLLKGLSLDDLDTDLLGGLLG
jgi:hypothetical protein